MTTSTNQTGLSIYLAGMFADKGSIHEKMLALQCIGFVITHDWTSFEQKGDDAARLRMAATLDINGVKAADVVVCIMNDDDYEYRGTFTEIGCALGLTKRIIIICGSLEAHCRSNCFFHHPGITVVPDWEACLQLLRCP